MSAASAGVVVAAESGRTEVLGVVDRADRAVVDLADRDAAGQVGQAVVGQVGQAAADHRVGGAANAGGASAERAAGLATAPGLAYTVSVRGERTNVACPPALPLALGRGR